MFRRVLPLLLICFSGTLVAKGDRLKLDSYPSTYLADCEGIAYIYKVKNKVRLGIRAVKKCGKIEIDGLVRKMDRYDLGYRFETIVSTSEPTRVSVFSRRKNYEDHFIIGDRRDGSHSGQRPRQENASLQVLRACGESFQSSSMKNYCHESLKASDLDTSGIARLCAKNSFISAQKDCLQEAVKFRYSPLEVMLACDEYSDRRSEINKCYKIAREYKRPPLKILGQCRSMYSRNSLRLKCVERLITQEKPVKALGLLQACKNEFSRDSLAETCYEKVTLLNKDKKKTLAACSSGFNRTSTKFQCLELASKIKVNPAGVVRECSANQSRTSEALKCITGFTLPNNQRNGR